MGILLDFSSSYLIAVVVQWVRTIRRKFRWTFLAPRLTFTTFSNLCVGTRRWLYYFCHNTIILRISDWDLICEHTLLAQNDSRISGPTHTHTHIHTDTSYIPNTAELFPVYRTHLTSKMCRSNSSSNKNTVLHFVFPRPTSQQNLK